MKTFLIDLTNCVGCHACQIGCKDEHCDNDWMPYAKPQPEVGQFWFKVNQYERGAVPHVKVAYIPTLCNHCANPACKAACDADAIYTRDDGFVVIDPAKCNGCKACVDACPYGSICFNDGLSIAQKCTGCAHLLDGGHAVSVPRCMDNCCHEVISFGEEAELDLEGAETLHPEFGTQPRVYYKGLPKKFIAGTVYDPAEKEIIEGATVTATGTEGTFTATTDHFGDFWLKGLPDADWKLSIEFGEKKLAMDVSTKEKDLGLGNIALA